MNKTSCEAVLFYKLKSACLLLSVIVSSHFCSLEKQWVDLVFFVHNYLSDIWRQLMCLPLKLPQAKVPWFFELSLKKHFSPSWPSCPRGFQFFSIHLKLGCPKLKAIFCCKQTSGKPSGIITFCDLDTTILLTQSGIFKKF